MELLTEVILATLLFVGYAGLLVGILLTVSVLWMARTDGWTAAFLAWDHAPWLMRFVTRRHADLELHVRVTASILEMEGIPFGSLPEIRYLPADAAIPDASVLAKWLSISDHSLILVARRVVEADAGWHAFVIGHEMGHAVQHRLQQGDPCDHWLIRWAHEREDVSKEDVCDMISWFCIYWVLQYAQNQPVDQEEAKLYIKLSMLAMQKKFSGVV